MFLKHTVSKPTFKMDVCEITSVSPSLRWREATVQKGNFKQVHPIYISRYTNLAWVYYGSRRQSQHVLDAIFRAVASEMHVVFHTI